MHPSKSNIASVAFSEKSWIYFLALQLLFSEGSSSFLGKQWPCKYSTMCHLPQLIFYFMVFVMLTLLLTAAGISGLLTGYLYINDVMSIQKFRLPTIVSQIFSPLGFIFGPTAASSLPNGSTPTPPGRPGAGNGAGGPIGGQGQGGANGRGEALFGGQGNTGFQPYRMAAPPPPPEEAIESLINLGFERDRVIRALQSRDNNVEAAANFLLSGND
jgi:hypothetical protein